MTAESTPPPGGFAGLSRRRAFGKPVIAAVNGLCLGGGMELVVNVTLVVAARGAQFGLPEVRRGVVAFAGALPRLGRTVGRQRAVEMAVTGRTVGADEGRAWGFVNRVVDDGDVVAAALEMAQDVCKGSPDAVAVTLAGVELAWEPAGGVEDASDRLSQRWAAEVLGRENYTEGLAAFAEKRDPVWVVARSSSKL
ncbi:MAG: hypothetical protein M1840_002832 [Geoglossum simile]|nr:MAG: hypothetical protein M1840_002832 [Geoglossum simile]